MHLPLGGNEKLVFFRYHWVIANSIYFVDTNLLNILPITEYPHQISLYACFILSYIRLPFSIIFWISFPSNFSSQTNKPFLFESLNLPKEQKEPIRQWIEAIRAQNATYTMVVFLMAMQCCFSLLVQLADL